LGARADKMNHSYCTALGVDTSRVLRRPVRIENKTEISAFWRQAALPCDAVRTIG
jgi:hypothetical protein